MSSIISFSGGSGPDTKVRVNSINPPKEIQFLGAGVSVVSNDVNGTYDITISGAAAGLATTSAAGIVQLATPSSDTTAGHVIQANDARLSNARTPTTHGSTHKSGGADPIRLDELSAPVNNNNLNVSTLAHGLCPILPNDATKYLDGTGLYSVPAGTGGAGEANTYSTVGTGAPWTLTKTGVNLPFRSFIAGSNKLALTTNTNDLTLDINQANLSIAYSQLTSVPTNIAKTDTNNSWSVSQNLPTLSTIGTNVVISNTGLTAARTYTFPDSTTTLVGTGDSRLSDARTPTAHKSTHQSGGSDSIALDTLATTTDITTLNSTTSAHGLLPKLSGTGTDYFDGTGGWSTPIMSFSNSYTYTIYNQSGTIKARNNKTGIVQFSNANLDPVITSILGTGDASFEVMSGTYNLSSGFTGWTAQPAMSVKLQQDTVIKVPNNYAGIVWTYPANVKYSSFIGGRFEEQGTPGYGWECFLFAPASPNGTFSNVIKDVTIKYCNVAIHLKTDTSSWINSNLFQNIFGDQVKTLVYFEHLNAWTDQVSGCNANEFDHVQMQSNATSPQAQNGITGVNGWWNTFNHCMIWDMAASNASARSMNISSNGKYTLILGGLTTQANYLDSGSYTTVIDYQKGIETHGFSYVNTTPAGGFEDVAKWSIGSSVDYFALANNTNSSGSFAPIFRTNGTSANLDRFTPIMLFQTVGKAVNDTSDADSMMVFEVESPGHAALVNRPCFSFRNTLSPLLDIVQIWPSYIDLKSTTSIKNAVIKSSENTIYGLSQDPIVKRTGLAEPSTFTSTASAANIVTLTGVLTGYTGTGAGTNSQSWDTTEGLVINWASSTTANALIGIVPPTGGVGIARRAFAVRTRMRSKVDAVASSVSRLYFGFSSATTLPGSDVPLATTDSGILVGFRSTDTNYTIFTNNGGGSALTATALSTPVAKDTSFHTIEINWSAGGNANIVFDGVNTTVSTALPATTTNLLFYAVAENATAAIRTHTVKGIWFESA